MLRNLGLPVTLMLAACATVPMKPSVSSNPVSKIVEQFFVAIEREDLAALDSLLAADATVVAMFNPSGDSSDAAIRTFPASTYFGIVTRNYENIVFVDRTFSVADDGKTVWMQARGDLRVAATGAPYRNRYVFRFDLADGRISTLTEWVNTVTLTQQGIVAQPGTP